MRRSHGGAAGPGLLDFSVNLNPLGPPDALGLLASNDHLTRYPEPQSQTLQHALAQHHRVAPESVLVTNGACEAIELAMASFKPRRVVVLVPAFTEYEDAARVWGHEVRTIAAREEDGFEWDFSRLDVHPDDLVVLGNPANPTGVVSTLPKLEATLLVDETFLDFVDRPQTAIGRPRTLVVRSFTKIFACPGLRLGYIVGDVERLRERQAAWSVGRLAQLAGEALLRETAYLEFTRRFVRECREDLTKGLQSLAGAKVFPAAANFVFFGLPQANAIARRLHERGIVVRQCCDFTGLAPDRYLRVAVRKRSENQRLLEALDAAR
ncbi:MAG TPA: aminotransferase class I/II-fold pyridoxal phosphate-dependent enzyme [Pirellulales bacterium]|nr:aminotransferase class I/II-fold pyridoxal phosphate-dependent enzyme [Pirellulales bacterium]